MPMALAEDNNQTKSAADPNNSIQQNNDEAPVGKPRILVMHASVGSGHKSAAVSVAQALEIMRNTQDPALLKGVEVPEDLEVEVIDIFDFGRIKFDGDKTASLFTGASRPIYDIIWRYFMTGRLLWGGGTIWSHLMFPTFTDYIKENPPLAIVCTHITAANVVVGARMISGIDFPLICVPTDYETEGLWPHKYGDLFCVANESMVETLRPRKVSEDRICITGIPVRSVFREERDKVESREKFGLPQDKTVVLALAGSRLQQPYVHFRNTMNDTLPFFKTAENMHLVLVCGADAQYANHMRSECERLKLDNVTVYEFIDDIAGLMASCDLVVCKPGGLTVTECLCAQAPMILVGKSYGQEKINVRMLTSVGAASHVTTSRELIEALRAFGENTLRIKAMLVNGAYLRRADAAFDISRRVLMLGYQRRNKKLPIKKHFMRFYIGGKPAHTR